MADVLYKRRFSELNLFYFCWFLIIRYIDACAVTDVRKTQMNKQEKKDTEI